MITLSVVQLIGIIVGSGGLISVATTLIFLKYRKTKEKGLAIQELKKAENLDIENIREIINLYKNGMKDLQDLMQSREAELSKKISEYDTKLSRYESENKRLKDLVSTLKRDQVIMKSKLDTITVQSLKDCDTCSFKSDCIKYKAKQYINDDKSINNEY